MSKVYLKQCRLIDCQSLKDVTFDFVPGYNVITAPNSTGKSVFFKILKITGSPTYYTSKKRKRLIRRGCEYAQAMYLFSDNSICRVIIAPTKVIYYYATDIENPQWNMKMNEQFSEVLEKLDLIVDNGDGTSGDSFIANILDLDQPLFLVTSDKRSDSRILSLITKNDDMSNCIERCRQKESEYKNRITNSYYLRSSLQESIASLNFVDCNKLSREIENGELLLPEFDKLCSIGDSLESFVPTKEKVMDFDSLLSILNVSSEIEILDFDSCCVEIKDYGDLTKITEFLDNLYNLQNKLNDIECLTSKDFDNLILLCDISKTVASILTDIDNCQLKYDDTIESKEILLDSILSMQNLYNKFNLLESCKNLLKESNDNISYLEDCLLKFGNIVDCPRKGKVVYTDEKCIPYSK